MPEEQTQVTEAGTGRDFKLSNWNIRAISGKSIILITWNTINEDFEESAEEITIQAEVHNEQEEEK